MLSTALTSRRLCPRSRAGPACRPTGGALQRPRVICASQREEGFRKRGGSKQPDLHTTAAAAQRQGAGEGPHGGAGVDRFQAAQREMAELRSAPGQAPPAAGQAQQATPRVLTSDDEWEAMPAPKKWWLEAKAVLYSWLGTGVEPL